MSTPTIRNVGPVLKERLRVRAAQHGRSMEAELRTILKDVLRAEKPDRQISLGEAIQRRFRPLGRANELVIPPRTAFHATPAGSSDAASELSILGRACKAPS